MTPSHVLARRQGRNEPCAQSWKTMNVRIRNPAARIESAATSTGETSTSAYINPVSARYGTAEVATSMAPRRASGIAYGASVSRQNDGSRRIACGSSVIVGYGTQPAPGTGRLGGRRGPGAPRLRAAIVLVGVKLGDASIFGTPRA